MKNSRGEPSSPATIHDVAKMAGVTIGTVSRYLNGYRLRPENARKVESAIEATGYQVNPFARGLRDGRSFAVGVVIQEFPDISATVMAAVIEEELNEAGYSMVVCDYKKDASLLEKRLSFLLERSVDGAVLFSSSHHVPAMERFQAENVPMVVFGEEILEYQTDKIQLDNYSAGMMGADAFLKSGHEDVAVINGPPDSSVALGRYQGWFETFSRRGLEQDEQWVRWSDFTTRGGYEAMRSILDRGQLPTGVFVANYYMTVGALMAINEARMNVGEDLSVLGFDRFDPILLFKPEMTVIQRPIEQMARESAQLLLRRMQGDTADYPKKQVFSPSMHYGDSVRDLVNTG